MQQPHDYGLIITCLNEFWCNEWFQKSNMALARETEVKGMMTLQDLKSFTVSFLASVDQCLSCNWYGAEANPNETTQIKNVTLSHSKETVYSTTEEKKAWRIIAAYGLPFSLLSLLILVVHSAMAKARDEILTKLAILYHMSTHNHGPRKKDTSSLDWNCKEKNIYI